MIGFHSIKIFHNRGEITENNFGEHSREREVNYFGGKKFVRENKTPMKSIQVVFKDTTTTLEIPNGCTAYYSIHSTTSFLPNGTNHTTHLGARVGLIRGNEVIEERFLDGVNINGLKK